MESKAECLGFTKLYDKFNKYSEGITLKKNKNKEELSLIGRTEELKNFTNWIINIQHTPI